jgi:hypothetical protein
MSRAGIASEVVGARRRQQRTVRVAGRGIGGEEGIMHGTLDQLRDRYPGRWLLIRLDGSDAEEGTLLAAHKDPERVERELEKQSRQKLIRRQPLYVTYSLPEGQELPAFAL